ncbi:MAG: hypothetical protein IPM57_08275 [Oligoflexia bacterium]|nr:hypothetical protein [Oligoflexia bacterium]
MFLFISLLFQIQSVLAQQPSYCEPSVFLSHEVKPKTLIELNEFGLLRLHAFEFGSVRLVGLAVGLSVPNYVKNLALKHSPSTGDQKYCTWYFNKWNWIAERDFNWHYLPIPLKNQEKMAKIYEEVLDKSFDQELPSFISCLQNHKYLALGCNNMQHRGPSVFSMLLAFSGCSPENSTIIANSLWGLNGIKFKTRLAIAQKGYQLGELRPYSRLRLQNIFKNSNNN